MVKDDLKKEIKQVFLKGMEDTFEPFAPAGEWQIKEHAVMENFDAAEFYVLTISSQLFRVFVLLHFTKTEQSESVISETLRLGSNNMDDDKFYDYLGEVGNGICGALKRELNKTVPSLGMSTPNRLDKGCFKYIDGLNIEFETHASVELHGQVMFFASVYVCPDEELNYEVKTHVANEDEVDSGDLEFF